jgi:hypothetical protein
MSWTSCGCPDGRSADCCFARGFDQPACDETDRQPDTAAFEETQRREDHAVAQLLRDPVRPYGLDRCVTLHIKSKPDLTKPPLSCLRFLAVRSPKKPARPVPKLSIHGPVSRSTRRLPLTGAEWVLVSVFAVASFALFGLDAVDAAANNRVYLGAASAAAQDSMQYLAWATDAAHHGLIANLYGFNNGGHVFFHPIWLVTGLLHVDAGVSYVLLLGLWQAVGPDPAGHRPAPLRPARARQRRSGPGDLADARAVPRQPVLPVRRQPPLQDQRPVDVGADRRELRHPVDQRLLPGRAHGHRDDRLPDRAGAADGDARPADARRRALAAGGFRGRALGATAAFLHPWQGTELAVLTVGVAIWGRLLSRRNVRLLLPLAGIALPLLYYLILPKIDAGWATATRGSGPQPPDIPLPGWLTTFGPVVLASIPGWRTRATSDRQRLLRLWPIAVLITFVAVPTAKYHTFAGVSVPLALLAVQGWRRVLEERRLEGRNPRVLRFLVTASVVVLVFGAAPATTWLLVKKGLGARVVAELDRADADALDYLARQPRGGVLTTSKVGIWVPALTDDSTYVGHFVWSPQWARGRKYVNRLFDLPDKRPLSPTAALALIEQPGARYVLEPCGAREKLWPLLKPRGYSRHAFGCATVYARPIRAHTLSVEPSAQ